MSKPASANAGAMSPAPDSRDLPNQSESRSSVSPRESGSGCGIARCRFALQGYQRLAFFGGEALVVSQVKLGLEDCLQLFRPPRRGAAGLLSSWARPAESLPRAAASPAGGRPAACSACA